MKAVKAAPDKKPDRNNLKIIGSGSRRRRLYDLLGFLIAICAAAALCSGKTDGPELTAQAASPAEASPGLYLYRPDSGQMASPAGGLAPNLLTRLNNGQLIELKSANPAHLAHLPSLGLKSALKAAESGCLNNRQQKTLDGIINESCYPNKL